MSINLRPETKKHLLGSIKRFFAEHMDAEIGDLKATLVLEFFAREIGPSIYNQAIADAQAFLQERVSDLSGARYEAEFDYWKK